MPVDIMLTVVFTSIIQSVFGAGVLLFGTPLLLLFGHDFVNVLFIACKEFSSSIEGTINKLMAFEKSYFLLMGIVHGLSNLGGSLLTALVHHKQYGKDVARVTVASSYATFAAVQLLTLWAFGSEQIEVDINDTGVYMVVGALIFMLTDEMLYSEINRAKYQRIFAVFLAVSGAMLVFRALV